MSASSAIFERIKLPTEKYKMHFLEWLMPLSKDESLSDYAKRFAKQITAANPILIGVSFGGILAQEIAQIIPCKKIIIISSIKSPTEYSFFFKTVKTTRLYKLYPVTFLNFLEQFLYKKGSSKIKNTLTVYRKFLPIRNKLYTQWAIRSFLLWKGSHNNLPLLHIHGNSDQIIPIKYIKNCEVIKNGTHAMILTKSSSIEQYILRYLA